MVEIRNGLKFIHKNDINNQRKVVYEFINVSDTYAGLTWVRPDGIIAVEPRWLSTYDAESFFNDGTWVPYNKKPLIVL